MVSSSAGTPGHIPSLAGLARECADEQTWALEARLETHTISETVRSIAAAAENRRQLQQNARAPVSPLSVTNWFQERLRAGHVTILAARPSVGCTILALNVSFWLAAQRSFHVAYFTGSSRAEELAGRLLCARSGVDNARLRGAFLDESDSLKLRAAARELEQTDIVFKEG